MCVTSTVSKQRFHSKAVPGMCSMGLNESKYTVGVTALQDTGIFSGTQHFRRAKGVQSQEITLFTTNAQLHSIKRKLRSRVQTFPA